MILNLLIISAIGGLIYLDSGPIGQWMISQPIVCAPLIAWICGDPVTGLMIGALLQLLWTGRLPVGSSIPPESPISAVVATIVFVFAKKSPEVGVQLDWMTMVMAISFGIGAGVLGGRMTVASRELNDRFCVYADRYVEQGAWKKINMIPWIGNILLWLCASLTIFVLCSLSLMVLTYIQIFHFYVGLFKYYSWVLVTLGVAVMLDLFHFKTRIKLLLSGLIVGYGIGYFTHFINR